MIAHANIIGQNAAMLSKGALLKAVEEAAESRAEIARVLNVAPARITELYASKRDLSFDEARKLYLHYRIAEDGEIGD